MKLAKFNKTPVERKRYTLDYTDWLDTGETVSSIVFSVTPVEVGGLEVDAYAIDGSGLTVGFYVNAGLAGSTYTVDVQMTTSSGQIKEDQVIFDVKEP